MSSFLAMGSMQAFHPPNYYDSQEKHDSCKLAARQFAAKAKKVERDKRRRALLFQVRSVVYLNVHALTIIIMYRTIAMTTRNTTITKMRVNSTMTVRKVKMKMMKN